MEIICVPAIVTIVYAIIEIYKAITEKKGDLYLKLIPIIAGIIGGVFGIILFYIAPVIMVANTWWMALIVGVFSGLSAVGGNQIFKQLKKYNIEVKDGAEAEQDPTEKNELNNEANIMNNKADIQQTAESTLNELLKQAMMSKKETKKKDDVEN